MDKKNKSFDEIKQRLLYFAENQSIKKSEFYEKIGLMQSNFSGKAATSSLKSENIIKVLMAYPQINPDWLILGNGEMIRNSQQVGNIQDSTAIGVNVNGNNIAINPDPLKSVIDIVENYQKQTFKFQEHIERLITIIEKKI